jgi:hypothetical protein
MTNRLTNALLEEPKRLFLIDSLGAGLTVFMLLGVLLPFEQYIGMPPPVLRLLAVPASVFALYSVCCYWLARTRWQPFMRIIAVANLVYCCVTAGLIIRFYNQLTTLGVAYFALEISIVCVLVWIEQKAVTQN